MDREESSLKGSFIFFYGSVWAGDEGEEHGCFGNSIWNENVLQIDMSMFVLCQCYGLSRCRPMNLPLNSENYK